MDGLFCQKLFGLGMSSDWSIEQILYVAKKVFHLCGGNSFLHSNSLLIAEGKLCVWVTQVKPTLSRKTQFGSTEVVYRLNWLIV